MSRYIDVDELLFLVGLEDTEEARENNQGGIITLEDIDKLIVEDVKPVVCGEWIDDTDVYCSNCGEKALRNYYYDVQTYSDFSPHCGADLRGDENE